MPRIGWGAVVLGEPMDLADWAYVLKQPFDPWIEVHADQTMLRSSAFDELSSGEEVRDCALIEIERLNGAIAVSQGTKPVHFGGVVEFDADGRLHRTIFPQTAVFETRFGRPTVTVLGPDGKAAPAPPPTPSEPQSWAKIADKEPWLNDALIYFGRATNWFDVFKTLECLIERFGGRKEKEKNFLALNWAPKEKVKLLNWTANWVARHAERKFERPPNPMELPEARRLVSHLLRRALEESALSAEKSYPSVERKRR